MELLRAKMVEKILEERADGSQEVTRGKNIFPCPNIYFEPNAIATIWHTKIIRGNFNIAGNVLNQPKQCREMDEHPFILNFSSSVLFDTWHFVSNKFYRDIVFVSCELYHWSKEKKNIISIVNCQINWLYDLDKRERKRCKISNRARW